MPYPFAVSLLRALSRSPNKVPANVDHEEWRIDSALGTLKISCRDFERLIQGKTVVDFGSGVGFQSAALLRAGAAKVLALEISPVRLEKTRKLLAELGLQDSAEFSSAIDPSMAARFDVVLSQNAMEHYSNPGAVLQQIRSLLKPRGRAIVTFGPPWYAPHGAHMNFFTRLPWVQLIFSESTVMAVRARFRADGAEKYSEVDGGLNQMSVSKFEHLLRDAGFRVLEKNYACVRGLNFLGKLPLVRELFVNHVTVILERP